MARVAIPVTTASRAGVAMPTETDGDATNNHTIPNTGREILIVRNSNGASTARTLTIHLARTIDGQAITNRTYSIAAGATRVTGPFPPADYGDNLLVDVDNAELKLSVIRV